MMLHTHLRDLLGIEVAILAARMGFISGPELAAAVSNAGGLGIMSFSGNPPPVLRAQIRCLWSLTTRPSRRRSLESSLRALGAFSPGSPHGRKGHFSREPRLAPASAGPVRSVRFVP
jgi:NAD(P)H-dependent flavin oxidoreductase YrpB (nitropropane dioxygenase family)